MTTTRLRDKGEDERVRGREREIVKKNDNLLICTWKMGSNFIGRQVLFGCTHVEWRCKV